MKMQSMFCINPYRKEWDFVFLWSSLQPAVDQDIRLCVGKLPCEPQMFRKEVFYENISKTAD